MGVFFRLASFPCDLSKLLRIAIVCIFLLLSKHSKIGIYHRLFNHSSIKEHLNCFHCWLFILNKTSMNIHVLVFCMNVSFHFFSINMHKSTIAGLCCMYMFNFVRNCHIFSRVAVWFYIPMNNVWKIQFLYILTNTWCCHYFLF